MPTTHLDLQGDWNAQILRDVWPRTPDQDFFFKRIVIVTDLVIGEGPRGRALEVAAADGTHACHMAERGFDTFILEPSPVMLAAARIRMRDRRVHVTLVRGIVESLPFADGSFDTVLCDSALDHFADPENGLREMARITKPDGRVIVSFVNYGGVAAKVARAAYAVGRGLRLVQPVDFDFRLFWDTPVPHEHQFECTFANVQAMAAPYLAVERAWGVSIGHGVPGWGKLLDRFHRPRVDRWLDRLDTFARNHPQFADFVISVWRPRPKTSWPVDEYRTRLTNPVYRRMIREERAYWDRIDLGPYFAEKLRVLRPVLNKALTGDAKRSWVVDLAARGPFRHAAMLGIDDLPWAAEWLEAGGSERLDVYDLSPDQIDRARRRLGPLASRVRFVETDLNFATLPAGAYDAVWTSSLLCYVTNLEWLLDHIKNSLRPGGLLGLHEWVGERRMRYSDARLERSRALLASVPARYRLCDTLDRPEPPELTPFRGVRSDEIRRLVHDRFEVVHEAFAHRLLPVALLLDVTALEREAPDVLARVLRAEEEAAAENDPALPPGVVYGIYRRPER